MATLRPLSLSFLWLLPFASAQEEEEPVNAVLFPWFVEVLGVLVFFLLTRYANWVPYTAVVFILGTFMGIGIARLQNENKLNESMFDFWMQIDSEVLLNVFLPGLVFKDSASLDLHLFQIGFFQILTFAFPMVLAGTALTALVAKYIFPYDWSFNLAMTFGSILSATDPVAVNALLEQVGAPPRLKVHIAGESLLNDGSAIVFYSVFSALFLYDVNPILGEQFDGKSGTAKFFRMSCGGAAIGIFFGLGLVALLFILNRQLSREENVVQVVATITIAYLCYYTADVVWETSGVVAVVTCGLLSNALGRAMLSDIQLYDDFWSLVDQLLNTVLFALGGLVWGHVIANTDDRVGEFTGTDWGYLFLLYVLLMVIRFLIWTCFYPLISRIGLKTTPQEQVFQAYGGLRGAVGISLAIAIDSIIRNAVEAGEADTKYELQTNKLFGFVGGTAFLTLIINATTAGPVLRALGLTKSTAVREHVVKIYRQKHMRGSMIQNFLHLLTRPGFSRVSFAVIRNHISILNDLTKQELLAALEEYKAAMSQRGDYREPNLQNILPYLEDSDTDENVEPSTSQKQPDNVVGTALTDTDEKAVLPSELDPMKKNTADFTDIELRIVFLAVLRNAYEDQIASGQLYDKGFLTLQLRLSLDWAEDAVNKGEPLDDWKFTFVDPAPWKRPFEDLWKRILSMKLVKQFTKKYFGERRDRHYERMRMQVHRCLSFVQAHRTAQKLFVEEFLKGEFLEEAKTVLAESEAECKVAKESLEKLPAKDREIITSHLFCQILAGKGAKEVARLHEAGLMKEQEAEKMIADIQSEIKKIELCSSDSHPGELPLVEEQTGAQLLDEKKDETQA